MLLSFGVVLAQLGETEKLTVRFSAEVAGDEWGEMEIFEKNGRKRDSFRIRIWVAKILKLLGLNNFE